MARRLELLCRHPDPVFVGRLLEQRWLRLADVVTIASRRPTTPALLRAIATRDIWLRHAAVRVALAENPYTPSGLGLALWATVPGSRVGGAPRLERAAGELAR